VLHNFGERYYLGLWSNFLWGISFKTWILRPAHLLLAASNKFAKNLGEISRDII